MDIINEIAIVSVGVITTATLGYCVNLIKKLIIKIDVCAKGTGTLLYDKLWFFYKKYVTEGNGTIEKDDFEVCHHVFEQYKASGRNGRGEKMWEEISKLRISE